jgi:photosystem II stability/assembly factor-like uncharacterized protein
MQRLTFADPADMQRFEAGEEWFSYDDGRTWTQERRPASPPTVLLTVTSVDRERGVIVVSSR